MSTGPGAQPSGDATRWIHSEKQGWRRGLEADSCGGTLGLTSRGAQMLALADPKGHDAAEQRPEGDEEHDDVQPQADEAEDLGDSAQRAGAHEVHSAPRMHVSHLVGHGGNGAAGL